MLGMTVCTAQVFTKQSFYYEIDVPDQELYCCKRTESKQSDAQCGRYHDCSVHHCKAMTNIIQEENRCKFVFIYI